jgi:uncharacterized protein YndB with AHSA1/START domain
MRVVGHAFKLETDSVVITILLNAPVERVWWSITNPEAIRRWYFTINNFKAEQGFKFKMYGERKGVQFPISCTVKEAETNKKLSYSWNYEDFPAETLVSFELSARQDQTELILTHSGLANLPRESTLVSVRNHRDAWEFILGSSLKQFLEQEAD